MDLISVIVPVYKVEAYLDQCVQSIVDQTYKNLEIILVDDGSPDNCGAMCDAWAAKDSRIQVVHQKNAGAGAARNTGIDNAKGKYIAFVDSDDYLCLDMYSCLISLMKDDIDIVECGYWEVDGDGGEPFAAANASIQYYSTSGAMKEHIQDKAFRQVIWNKLYRHEVISAIRFPLGKHIDDEFFTYQVLGNARKLVRYEKICYAYRQQPGSVMHTMPLEKQIQGIEAKCLRLAYLENNFPELVLIGLENLWFTCMYQGQLFLKGSSEKRTAFLMLKKVLKEHPIKQLPAGVSIAHRIWILMAKLSFVGTCRVRNLFRIGL